MNIPCFRKCSATTFTILVKVLGAVESPNGRHLNLYV